jgi:hypothetical protein
MLSNFHKFIFERPVGTRGRDSLEGFWSVVEYIGTTSGRPLAHVEADQLKLVHKNIHERPYKVGHAGFFVDSRLTLWPTLQVTIHCIHSYVAKPNTDS